MSFWSTSDNKAIEKSTAYESAGGNDFEPMPKGTQVLAAPDEAKWDNSDFYGDFISIRWTVLKPVEFQNRKIFQKLKVNDEASKVSDKAKRMLAVIDTNAGGKLFASDEAPTDETLQAALVNKAMVLSLDVYEITKDSDTGAELAEPIVGNWVRAVAPKGELKQPAPVAPRQAAPTQAKAPAPKAAAARPGTQRAAPQQQQQQQPAPDFDSFDDDIPF